MRNATPSHGDAERWVKGVVALPKTKVTSMDLQDSVSFGLADDVEEGTKKFIVNILHSMMPWRKGRTVKRTTRVLNRFLSSSWPFAFMISD